jgi:hypothetical protein
MPADTIAGTGNESFMAARHPWFTVTRIHIVHAQHRGITISLHKLSATNHVCSQHHASSVLFPTSSTYALYSTLRAGTRPRTKVDAWAAISWRRPVRAKQQPSCSLNSDVSVYVVCRKCTVDRASYDQRRETMAIGVVPM